MLSRQVHQPLGRFSQDIPEQTTPLVIEYHSDTRLTYNILCILTLIVADILLGIGVQNPALASQKIYYLWILRFGAVTPESLVAWNERGSGGLLLTVLVANSPQTLLSFLFLTYNGLYTCMLTASE